MNEQVLLKILTQIAKDYTLSSSQQQQLWEKINKKSEKTRGEKYEND